MVGWLGVVLAGCAGLPRGDWHPQATPAELEATVGFATFDARRLSDGIFYETNRVRVAAGVPRLRAHVRLADAAELQATTNALLQVTSHDNPLWGRAQVLDRVRASGLEPAVAAENVAMKMLPEDTLPEDLAAAAQRPWPSYAEVARRIVDQWMNSPPHRVNLLDPRMDYLACGVAVGVTPGGRMRLYAVQVFFVPKARASR